MGGSGEYGGNAAASIDGPLREYGYPTYCYTAPPPVVCVDYDENQAGHERNSRINSRPAWMHEHHPEWLAAREHEQHEQYEHH
jgi:hypothetical protein